jgi:hypothetical protein
VGQGAAVEKITASGPVYKLASVTDFPGRYTRSTGKAGLTSSGSSNLWLENNAGVIMHLQGTNTGAMLTSAKTKSSFAWLSEPVAFALLSLHSWNLETR